MNKIYLASRWSRQPELRQIRDQLHENGQWRVVSHWIDATRPENPDEKFFLSDEGIQRLYDDLADLRECDIVVADMLDGMGRRGGMMIEIGYGMGLGKPVILIGNPADCGIFGNAFTRTFSDWQAAFQQYF